MVVQKDSTARELLIERARACIGVSVYRKDALLEEAPEILNCFRFTQWLWNSVGVLLPDHQLIWPMAVAVSIEEVCRADLIFIPRRGYEQEEDDFGHVGVATDCQTVIHATKWRNTVVEDSLETFITYGCLGVRRIPDHLYCR